MLRKYFRFQPFIVGLVGFQHKLQNTAWKKKKSFRSQYADPQAEVVNEYAFKKKKRLQDTRRIIQNEIKNGNVHGLAVAISVNGETKFKESFGLGNIERNTKATTEMRGNIASITKPFTAYLIMKTFEEEKYGSGRQQTIFLNSTIQHEGILEPGDTHVFTPADLMHHCADFRHYSSQENFSVNNCTSALQAWLQLYRYFNADGSQQVFMRYPDGTIPNSTVYYSSLSYDVLGAFLELEQPSYYPFYDIATDELSRLNFNDSQLHRVQDVKFDYFGGYGTLGKTETYKNTTDRYLDRMRYEEMWHEEDPYLMNQIRPEIDHQLHNGNYCDFSRKYPSEGLVANVSDLIKFGDMFLRMEQDRSNGGPLSPSLAKLMWSYCALVPKCIGRSNAPYTHIGWNQQGLGFNLVTFLHKRGKDGQKFITSAYHGGRSQGYIANLYITTMKRENYLQLPNFNFAPKAFDFGLSNTPSPQISQSSSPSNGPPGNRLWVDNAPPRSYSSSQSQSQSSSPSNGPPGNRLWADNAPTGSHSSSQSRSQSSSRNNGPPPGIWVDNAPPASGGDPDDIWSSNTQPQMDPQSSHNNWLRVDNAPPQAQSSSQSRRPASWHPDNNRYSTQMDPQTSQSNWEWEHAEAEQSSWFQTDMDDETRGLLQPLPRQKRARSWEQQHDRMEHTPPLPPPAAPAAKRRRRISQSSDMPQEERRDSYCSSIPLDYVSRSNSEEVNTDEPGTTRTEGSFMEFFRFIRQHLSCRDPEDTDPGDDCDVDNSSSRVVDSQPSNNRRPSRQSHSNQMYRSYQHFFSCCPGVGDYDDLEDFEEIEMEELQERGMQQDRRNQPEGITVALISNVDIFNQAEYLVLMLTNLYLDELDVE